MCEMINSSLSNYPAACLGSSLLCAVVRGELKQLFEYSEEEEEEEKKEEEVKDEQAKKDE
jgi:minor histocompatibility antigen H13